MVTRRPGSNRPASIESAAAGDLPPARHRGRYGGYVVMALDKTRYCGRGSDRKLGRRALRGVVAAMVLGLGACNPIEGYRHLTGASKNDPNPATTPNTQNLAAGEKSPYPNLATVPPPPTQALTTAELDKLTQSLIADRKNAKYTSEQLQAGFDEGAGPPPPPPPPPAPPGAAASSGAAEPPAAPTGGPKAATAPSGAGTTPAPGQVASATPAAAKGPRKAGEPPEPGPMESSLQSPQISSLPEPAAEPAATAAAASAADASGVGRGRQNAGGTSPSAAGPGADARRDRFGRVPAATAAAGASTRRRNPHRRGDGSRQERKTAAGGARRHAGRTDKLRRRIRQPSAMPTGKVSARSCRFTGATPARCG